MAALDNAFAFSRTHNSEILFEWLILAIKHHYAPAMTPLHDFLVGQGRMKFCVPLYHQLMLQRAGASTWRKRSMPKHAPRLS
ncbi:MAG: leukotriene A4 hydrolase C-terminal domain-containing protein [Asticcacaulis sp.]